jgi:hypothetical protein
VKDDEDFLKNGKKLKTCIACREKSKKADVSKAELPKSEPLKVDLPKAELSKAELSKDVIKIEESIQLIPVQTQLIPVQTQLIPVRLIPVNPVKPEPVKWGVLSGRWVKYGEEQKLHKILLKKVHRQFKYQSAFAIHKYLTRDLLADIKDR